MIKKLAFIVVICAIALFLWGMFFGFTRKVLYTTLSPSQRYKVEIAQKRFLIEHAAYLNVFHDGSPIVQWKLLYTGDFLEGDFRSVYPDYAWDSESVFRIGNNAVSNDHFNDIQITNESPQLISYLLIETYSDKVVLLRIEPHASINIKFPFPIKEELSCQGEFADSKIRFGNEVRNLEITQKSGKIEIKIKDGNVAIESPELKLEPSQCCAPNRPSFDNEWLY